MSVIFPGIFSGSFRDKIRYDFSGYFPAKSARHFSVEYPGCFLGIHPKDLQIIFFFGCIQAAHGEIYSACKRYSLKTEKLPKTAKCPKMPKTAKCPKMRKIPKIGQNVPKCVKAKKCQKRQNRGQGGI